MSGYGNSEEKLINDQKRLQEFDWMKSLALVLLIFVHSFLYFSFPFIIYPIEWFMLGIFFFISGFLTFNSFTRYSSNIRLFFKSKFKSIYLPFIIFLFFYFLVATYTGVINADPLSLVFHGSLLNIFDLLNSGVYNLGYLWFVPFLLLFMLISCLLEKSIKNTKLQIITILAIWFIALLGWVYNSPFRLGWGFNQYFIVFMIGFWLSKSEKYEAIIKSKTLFLMIPILIFFSFNFSNMFTFSNALETTKYLLYVHGRSIILSLSAILLMLTILRLLKTPNSELIKAIAISSLFIYLFEPVIGNLLADYFFSSTLYSIDGLAFFPYQAMRIGVLFFIIPFFVISFRKDKNSSSYV